MLVTARRRERPPQLKLPLLTFGFSDSRTCTRRGTSICISIPGEPFSSQDLT